MLTTPIDWEEKSRIVVDFLNMILAGKVMDAFQHDICFPTLTFPSPWRSIDEPSTSSLFLHLLQRSRWSTIFAGENPKTSPTDVLMPRDTEIPIGIVHMSHSTAVTDQENFQWGKSRASEAAFYWIRKKMDAYQSLQPDSMLSDRSFLLLTVYSWGSFSINSIPMR